MLFFFFFNDTATTEIYTLSLHDALPILTRFSYTPETWARLLENPEDRRQAAQTYIESVGGRLHGFWYALDRKSTRLNSSHANISYAVFCLKKKKKKKHDIYGIGDCETLI